MDQFTKHMQTLFNGHKRLCHPAACKEVVGKMDPADAPAILPILLKLVDGCQNSELR